MIFAIKFAGASLYRQMKPWNQWNTRRNTSYIPTVREKHTKINDEGSDGAANSQ